MCVYPDAIRRCKVALVSNKKRPVKTLGITLVIAIEMRHWPSREASK